MYKKINKNVFLICTRMNSILELILDIEEY